MRGSSPAPPPRAAPQRPRTVRALRRTASDTGPSLLRPLMSATTDTQTLTVSEYAGRIERVVRQAGGAVVEGEVQKPRVSGGGAFMFDLTDGDALLPCKVL